jgi:plasmid maintenance system antidote protein VapI
MPSPQVLKLRQVKVKPLFSCQLEVILKEQLGTEYDEVRVAKWLGVTILTLRNILQGGTVKLENAIRLAQFVGKPVEEVWRLRP